MSTGTIYNFYIVFTKRGELLGGRSNSSTVQLERFVYGGGKSSTVEVTVGAQSIACAQSIAHSHMGDSICKKN